MRQDYPQNALALKLVRFGLAQSIKSIPRKSLVLNPFSDIRLFRRDIFLSKSICAIDCSWEEANYVLNRKVEEFGASAEVFQFPPRQIQ